MAYVKYAPLSALKRKSGQDLENETTKKSKIGPSTAPPVRELKVGVNKVPQARTSSFFARIQKPGHTAAVPTVSRAVTSITVQADLYIERQTRSGSVKRASPGIAKGAQDECGVSISEGGRRRGVR